MFSTVDAPKDFAVRYFERRWKEARCKAHHRKKKGVRKTPLFAAGPGVVTDGLSMTGRFKR